MKKAIFKKVDFWSNKLEKEVEQLKTTNNESERERLKNCIIFDLKKLREILDDLNFFLKNHYISDTQFGRYTIAIIDKIIKHKRSVKNLITFKLYVAFTHNHQTIQEVKSEHDGWLLIDELNDQDKKNHNYTIDAYCIINELGEEV